MGSFLIGAVVGYLVGRFGVELIIKKIIEWSKKGKEAVDDVVNK